VAGWLTNSCMLGGRFCTESACVPGANEDVRVCCWMGLGDEAEQHETELCIEVQRQCHRSKQKCGLWIDESGVENT